MRRTILFVARVNHLIISPLKMTGGTPEVRSDKSLTLLTFGPMDQWINGLIEQLTNGQMDQWSHGPIVQWS